MNAKTTSVTEVVCLKFQLLVDLEGQLSNPSSRLLLLVNAWHRLPAGEPSRTKATPPRRQRAEDRLGPERVAQLVADYRAGIPTTALMRTYGLGKGSVLRLLEAHDVPMRRQSLTVAEVHEAIRLYGQGWSLARIGQRFGRDHSVIQRALERAGVPRRDSHGRPR